MALKTIYKIHPAIGVARIGNSATSFFIGPEVPGRPPEGDSSFGSAVPPFKDGGQIKRQGARFRIWRYDDNGKGKYAPVEEVNLDTKDVEYIVWTVHLANKKAAFFTFRGLLGDTVYGPTGTPLTRRNASETNPKKLWIDPGLRKISGRSKTAPISKGTAPTGSQEFWPTNAPTPAITDLGELRTDAAGRLVVLGGHGTIGSTSTAAAISNYANNDGWFDDVSDGPVNANIKFKGIKAPIPAVGAWCLCGPPCFAPFSRNVVSLWDTLFDLAAREMTLPTNDVKYDGVLSSLRDVNKELTGKAWGHVSLSSYKPVFETDIWPILRAGLDAPFLFEAAKSAHSTLGASGLAAYYAYLADPKNSSGASVRSVLLSFLHQPGVAGDGLPSSAMPKQLGDDPYPVGSGGWGVTKRLRLVVTPTQYAMLERWASGNFTSTTTAPPPLPAATITPDGLDRAALESCVGGAFFPGIECSWQVRNPKLYSEPFRIDQKAKSQYLSESGTIEAGHFSRQMALPWAADFLQCRTENHTSAWAWWPVPRPHEIYPTEALAKAQGAMQHWARSTLSGAPANWASTGLAEPGYPEMFANWTQFGFVIRKGDVMFETERPPNVP